MPTLVLGGLGRSARWLVPAAGLVGLAIIVAMVESGEPFAPSSYATTSGTLTVAVLVAGIVLLGAATLCVVVDPGALLGTLVGLLAMTWLATEMVGWSAGPAWVRSVATVVAPFLVPLVVHATAAASVSGGRARAWRVLVVTAYATTAIYALVLALFRDPFRDLYCWRDCADNVLLLHALPGFVRSTERTLLPIAAATCLLAAAWSVRRLAGASSVARRARLVLAVPTVVAAVAVGVSVVVSWWEPGEDPRRALFQAAFLARAISLTAVGIGVIVWVLRTASTRRAVTRLAEDLDAASRPGSLRDALSRSLGDPSLEVAYWLPEIAHHVDADGRRVDPTPGPGQALTSIVRDGRPIAVVRHDQALADTHDLEHEIGATARLAIDNERLRASLLSVLADLQASRARVVATADDTRRRLERDLHDGAQQRLLAASYALRLATTRARDAGDLALAEELEISTATVQQALGDLRDIATGIFPAILTEAGLPPALAQLSMRAPVALEIVAVPAERLPEFVATTAYMVVATMLPGAKDRGATYLEVHMALDDGHLVLNLRDDGAPTDVDDLVHVMDRVGALGGEVALATDEVTVVIPCGS